MSLRDWQRNSWLVEHENSREEITALLAIVERDLANAKVAGPVRRLSALTDFARNATSGVMSRPALLPSGRPVKCTSLRLDCAMMYSHGCESSIRSC